MALTITIKRYRTALVGQRGMTDLRFVHQRMPTQTSVKMKNASNGVKRDRRTSPVRCQYRWLEQKRHKQCVLRQQNAQIKASS